MSPPMPPTADRDEIQRPALPALITDTPGFETVEVRWWHAEPLPAELHRLCVDAVGPAGTFERRVDTYLAHCGDAMSVKLRGGDLLDIKQRCGPAAASVLVAGVQGRVEQWRKWTLGCAVARGEGEEREAAVSPHRSDPTEHWVPVSKTRCLVGEGAATLELAEIETPGRRHWTVALDAPVEVGMGGLRDAAATLELARFPRWFDLESSASYATFIEPPAPTGLDPPISG